MMKKNYKYSPLKVTLILVIGFILLVMFINYKSKDNMTYVVLECKNNKPKADNYSETMTFRFLKKENGVLSDYYRTEVYDYTSDSTDKEKLFDYLVEYRNKMKSIIDSVNLKYDIDDKDNKLTVNTYINVQTLGEVFNSYFKNAGINEKSTLKNVFEILSIDDTYTCVETETK